MCRTSSLVFQAMNSARRQASALQRLARSTTLRTKLLDAPTNGVRSWRVRHVLIAELRRRGIPERSLRPHGTGDHAVVALPGRRRQRGGVAGPPALIRLARPRNPSPRASRKPVPGPSSTRNCRHHSVFKNATSSVISRGVSARPRGCFSFWKTSSSDRARPSCKNESRLLAPRSDGGLNS